MCFTVATAGGDSSSEEDSSDLRPPDGAASEQPALGDRTRHHQDHLDLPQHRDVCRGENY